MPDLMFKMHTEPRDPIRYGTYRETYDSQADR